MSARRRQLRYQRVYHGYYRPNHGHAPQGECFGLAALACRVSDFLLVCGQFWQFQRDLRFAWRCHWLYDVDVDIAIVIMLGAELNSEIEKAAGEPHAQRPKNDDRATRSA
jgi:hypothetical protein